MLLMQYCRYSAKMEVKLMPQKNLNTKDELANILRHYSTEGRNHFEIIEISKIVIPNNLSKIHPKKQIRKLSRAYIKAGYAAPIIITENNVLISGYGRILAAQEAGMTTIPAIVLKNISEVEADAIRLMDNRMAEDSVWDYPVLAIELEKILKVGYELDEIGFETVDYDKILHASEEKTETHEDEEDDIRWIDANIPPLVKLGDLYRLGDHFLYCGDSLLEASYKNIMMNEQAKIIVTDPPYNCKIKNFVCRSKHEEFSMASGEMTREQFSEFIKTAMKHLYNNLDQGGLAYFFMDWRNLDVVLNCGAEVFNELMNILVWDKGEGGQGGFYRSAHELIPIFKKKGKHQNHIQLGKYGRYRTNVLSYPGVRATNPQSLELLKLHPTVKNVGLLHDLLLDASSKNDIVLDCFGGSGSTLIAAERCNRRARIIEIDPRYCDVIIYRYELETGKKAKFVKNFGGANA